MTPQGDLRTCLYEKGAMSLRDLIRKYESDEQLKQALKSAVGSRARDGFEAEKRRVEYPVSESMATIGG